MREFEVMKPNWPPLLDLPDGKLSRQSGDGRCITTEVISYSFINAARLTPVGVVSFAFLVPSESDGFHFYPSLEGVNIDWTFIPIIWANVGASLRVWGEPYALTLHTLHPLREQLSDVLIVWVGRAIVNYWVIHSVTVQPHSWEGQRRLR